jgi:hypothetical protein
MDTKGEYRFSSLVKSKKKEKKSAVFYFAGKRDFYIYIYEVITWGGKKSSTNYYSRARARESKREGERERKDGYVWGRASEGKMIKRAPERHDNNVQF